MGSVNRSSIIRVVVLLIALAVIISERLWIWDEVIATWVSVY